MSKSTISNSEPDKKLGVLIYASSEQLPEQIYEGAVCVTEDTNECFKNVDGEWKMVVNYEVELNTEQFKTPDLFEQESLFPWWLIYFVFGALAISLIILFIWYRFNN